jgi:hypothetical protein
MAFAHREEGETGDGGVMAVEVEESESVLP